MFALFKKKSFILSIIVIVFIISVETFVVSSNKKVNKNIVGTKSVSNPVQHKKSQAAPKETVSPSKTVSSQNVATSEVTTSKKPVSPSKKTVALPKITSSQKTVPKSTVTTSKKTVSPAKTLPSASPQKYISNNLGLSVTLPGSWKNKYTVKEDNNGLVIKFKPVSNVIITKKIIKTL